MALIKSVRGFTPKIDPSVYVAENATIVGDVEIGKDSSIWFGAILRGDVNSIRIGNHVNIQDGVVLHALYQKSKVIIEDNVSVGHNAIIHGAIVHSNVLVGMGATILDNAEIGENCIIAANALVKAGEKVEPNSLYAGVPAKKVKDVSPEQIENIIKRTADNYHLYSTWFKEEDEKEQNAFDDKAL